jgi:hypothetical protein
MLVGYLIVGSAASIPIFIFGNKPQPYPSSPDLTNPSGPVLPTSGSGTLYSLCSFLIASISKEYIAHLYTTGSLFETVGIMAGGR